MRDIAALSQGQVLFRWGGGKPSNEVGPWPERPLTGSRNDIILYYSLQYYMV